MNIRIRFTVGLAAALLISCSHVDAQSQPSDGSKHVEFEGLKESYESCASVTFSVRSTSNTGMYLEVYAEHFQNGAWMIVDYPYDLKQPMSLYVKRVLVNPKLMKMGDSLALSYDRCSKPKFVKETDSAFKKAIVDKDKSSSGPVLQRFRVDIYGRENGELKLIAKEYSPQISRVTHANTPDPKN
jgi:hypothetical protein